jgi:hypothetical protein
MRRLALVALPLLWAVPAFAQEPPPHGETPSFTDEWTDPAPGLRHLVRTTDTPCSIHALVVDLSHPGVHIRATPYDERWSTVSEYATRSGVAAATNGGFWGFMQHAEGVTAGGGQRWPDGHDDDEVGFFAVTHQGRAWISPPELVDDAVADSRVSEAISGQPMLVRDGTPDEAALEAFESSRMRHPRTAAGVSRDGTKVILIVVDGRQGFSHGATLYELAGLFVELGAWSALNLDGGGSSTMFVATEGGVVNSPSGGRWEARLGLGAQIERHPNAYAHAKIRVNDAGVDEIFVRGSEREVMNHIGVIAPAPGEEAAPPIAAVGPSPHGQTVVVGRPRPPAVRLGRSREVLFPLAAAVGVTSPFVVAWLLWRRRRRKLLAKRAAATT